MAADNNNSNNIDEASWKFLPNVHQLSHYLPEPDLIQLSLTCSHFRYKLNSVIFQKLELIDHGKNITGEPIKPNKKKQFVILWDVLEEDYKINYRFVKHCIFNGPYNSFFIKKFFYLFTNITNLELNSGTSDYENSAINCTIDLNVILYPLKKLEFLTIRIGLIGSLEVDTKFELKLPLCLKVLNVLGRTNGKLGYKPIENINGEYTELEQVSLISNNMLTNMATYMKSLTIVDIFSDQYFCPKLLAEFFISNPQLKKITIPYQSIDNEVIKSILQLNQLAHLNITDSRETSFKELHNFVANTSIKHINISCSIAENILIPILNNLKSLHTLEFSQCDFHNFSQINWFSYTGKIPILYLNGIWNADYDIDEGAIPDKFDIIKFSNMFELKYYDMYYGFQDFNNWKVIQDDPLDITEFRLVKKREENQ